MIVLRLNGLQRATFQSDEIDGRPFVAIDILTTIEDGSERLTRALVDAERIEAICEALASAATERSAADLTRGPE